MLFVFLSYFKFMIKWLNAGTSRRHFCEEHAGNLSHTNETWSTTAVCRIGSSPACCRPTSWFGYRTYTDPRSTFVVCLDIWRRSCPTYTVTLETFITKMSVAYLCYKIDPIGDAWHTYLGNTSGYSLGMYAHWRSHYILHHCRNLVHFFWNKNIGEGLV